MVSIKSLFQIADNKIMLISAKSKGSIVCIIGRLGNPRMHWKILFIYLCLLFFFFFLDE